MVLMKMKYNTNGTTGLAVNIEDKTNTTDGTLNEGIPFHSIIQRLVGLLDKNPYCLNLLLYLLLFL